MTATAQRRPAQNLDQQPDEAQDNQVEPEVIRSWPATRAPDLDADPFALSATERLEQLSNGRGRLVREVHRHLVRQGKDQVWQEGWTESRWLSASEARRWFVYNPQPMLPRPEELLSFRDEFEVRYSWLGRRPMPSSNHYDRLQAMSAPVETLLWCKDDRFRLKQQTPGQDEVTVSELTRDAALGWLRANGYEYAHTWKARPLEDLLAPREELQQMLDGSLRLVINHTPSSTNPQFWVRPLSREQGAEFMRLHGHKIPDDFAVPVDHVPQ